MNAPPRPRITALPRAAASSMTARVSCASRSWTAVAGSSSAGSGGSDGLGRARGQRRRDALPQAGQLLVVALRLLLRDARRAPRPRATISRSRNSAPNRSASCLADRAARGPNWREMVMTGIGVGRRAVAAPAGRGWRPAPAMRVDQLADRAGRRVERRLLVGGELDLDDLLDARRPSWTGTPTYRPSTPYSPSR